MRGISLLFDEGNKNLAYFGKIGHILDSGWRGQLHFYPTSQEITVFGIKNAFGGCLYFIPRA